MNFRALLSLLALLTLIGSNSIQAQDVKPATLTGKIIDGSDNSGLVGASVLLVGTYKGASTNIDGEFVISGIKPGDYQIKVQYYGYETKEFKGLLKAFEVMILISTFCILLAYLGATLASLKLQFVDRKNGKDIHMPTLINSILAALFSTFAIIGAWVIYQ